jgi:hypothetical protein
MLELPAPAIVPLAGRVCGSRDNNAVRGADAEYWLANQISRLHPGIMSSLASTLGAQGACLGALASVHGTEGGKCDVAARLLYPGKARLAKISCKMCTPQARPDGELGNQLFRKNAQLALASAWIPQDLAALAAAREWLRSPEAASDESLSLLRAHWTMRWRELFIQEAFGSGRSGADALFLLRCRHEKSDSVAIDGLFLNRAHFDRALLLAGVPGPLGERFGNDAFWLQRKGGDGGGAGAQDLQGKINVNALFDMFAG